MRTASTKVLKGFLLKSSLARVSVAGCLGTVYFTILSSPAQTQFFRAIGADEFFFGLLTGIPLLMLFLQFAGAFLVNRVRSRKGLFLAFNIISRLMSILIVLVPLLFPSAASPAVLLAILFIIAAGSVLQNMATPFWFSWMADLIPGRILNRYWGNRQRWIQMVWLIAYIGVALFAFALKLPIRTLYFFLTVIAVVAGVIDIVLFIGVAEPDNTIVRGKGPLTIFLEPFRHHEFKTFILFWCAWSFCATVAMAFMQYYILKGLNFTVWQTTIAFCATGIGNALTSKYWGRIADRRGHTPVLSLCVKFKPLIALAFCFVTPGNALWFLPLMFLFDGLWNAGMDVAANGYMLKIAPRQNRSMYVATITGLAGLCAG
ncbi:MAG: MFS transporter, partial [Chitinivibrionales bacterium]|nr:MFS transporter [Chitinivibrionales bacterium]